LMLYAARAWGALAKYFEQPRVEVVLESDLIQCEDGKNEVRIIGTADVLSPIGGADAIVLDWKSGYIDDGYHQQMAGYAYSAWCAIGKPEESKISVVVVFLRHRYHRVVQFTADRLREWEYDLTHNVLASQDKYQPGKQCRFCELYATCSARRHEVGGTLDAMMFGSAAQDENFRRWLEEATAVLAGLTEQNKDQTIVGEVVTKLLYRVRLAAQCIEDCKSLLRAAVERVGPIPLHGATSLVVREVNVRTLDSAKAITVLRSRLSDDQICQAMKLSLPTVLSTYAKQYARGQKRDAREQLEKELEEAHAISIGVRKRMEEIDSSLLDLTTSDQETNDAPSGESTDVSNPDG